MLRLVCIVSFDKKKESICVCFVGQFDEHEAGRSKEPLIFAFTNNDLPKQAEMRIGRNWMPGYRPEWSRKFPLEPSVISRKLQLASQERKKPPIVYNIGVEVSACYRVSLQVSCTGTSWRQSLQGNNNGHTDSAVSIGQQIETHTDGRTGV